MLVGVAGEGEAGVAEEDEAREGRRVGRAALGVPLPSLLPSPFLLSPSVLLPPRPPRGVSGDDEVLEVPFMDVDGVFVFSLGPEVHREGVRSFSGFRRFFGFGGIWGMRLEFGFKKKKVKGEKGHVVFFWRMPLKEIKDRENRGTWVK
jgi:hypothetical protein